MAFMNQEKKKRIVAEIEKVLGFTPEVPPSLAALEVLPEDFDRMTTDYDAFRDYLAAAH